MRVLVTGLGGELGTRVALLLEAQADVEAIVGIDIEPPRRYLTRTDFHRIDPRDRARNVALVRDFEPTVVVHVGTYEPNARCSPKAAVERTEAGTIGVLGAAAECSSLERIVLRSCIEVYGRGRGAATRPDESVPPEPTTPFGVSLLHAERVAGVAGDVAGVPVTALRLAPVLGPHFPSPLGRYLRLPVVPVSATSDLPFSLLHQEDAAAAIVAAVASDHDGPLNVVGDGAITASQAARFGGRLPLPIAGPAWAVARVAAEVAGSPLPEHLRELLIRGRTADGAQCVEVLGVHPRWDTVDVVKDLFQWAGVTYVTFGDAKSEVA
jgi:UDP-glucose 4-epimerase